MINIADSIIKYFANLDSAGSSNKKIDTLLEYNKLGTYLNGGFYDNKLESYSNLDENEQTLLKTFYNSLKDKFLKSVTDNEKLPKINIDNALEYANLENQLTSWSKDDDELSKLMCKKMREAMYKFAMDNGYELDGDDPDEFSYTFIMRELKKIIQLRKEREEIAQKTLANINKPYNNAKLKNRLHDYIKENNIKPLSETNSEIDFGNGKFDKIATQKTNVCWALASINSLLTSEKGTKLLESNLYYDKKTGVYAIHLQEAEDNGFLDGIYIITPDDILSESGKLAEGEGDATAYLIAIKRYFTEVNQNPELADKMEAEKHTVRDLENGNYGFRLFEILTGGIFSKYDYSDMNKPLQKGIGSGSPSACGKFEYVADIINSKKGAVTIAVGGHSISVIGARDGKLLVQESNNSDDFSEEYSDIERNHVIFNRIEDINGAPAYELSQDDFEHYIQAVSFIKWE